METTHKINQYIIALTGKEEANLLFIGTASHDAEDHISAIHSEFERLRCVVKELSLTSEKYTDDEIDNLLNQADIIYVGGGDTAFMIAGLMVCLVFIPMHFVRIIKSRKLRRNDKGKTFSRYSIGRKRGFR